MSRKLVILSIAGAAALLLAVPVVFAHRAGLFGEGCPLGAKGWHGRGGLARLHALHDELNLTDAQMKALHEIFDKTRAQNAEAKKSLHAGLMDAAGILLQDPENLAAARIVLEKQDTAADQLKANLLGGVAEGLRVLTPEQRQKLSQRLAEHAAKRD
jgi:Spy/CpxP family protein refolding chaperone